MIQQLGANGNESKEIEELLSAIPNFSYGVEGLRSVVSSDEANKFISRLQMKRVRSLAFDLAKNCHEVFYEKCKFKLGTINCCEAFLPVFGEHGICFAFNPRKFGEFE
jgi:hypothetical protein